MTDVLIETGNLEMDRHREKSCLQCPQAKEPDLDRFSASENRPTPRLWLLLPTF